MPHTPAWYPGKSDVSIEDDADTLELCNGIGGEISLIRIRVHCAERGMAAQRENIFQA